MALITCPECGQQISDKAPACIHCGFPLNAMQKDDIFNMVMNDTGKKHIVSLISSDLKNFGIQKADADRLLATKNSIIFYGVKEENVQLIKKHFERHGCTVSFVPSECTEPDPLNDTWREYTLKIADRYDRKPHCPTCGSTNIKTISFTRKAVGVATLGIFSKSARSQFQCKDCGYKW